MPMYNWGAGERWALWMSEDGESIDLRTIIGHVKRRIIFILTEATKLNEGGSGRRLENRALTHCSQFNFSHVGA
jgi:hypothetical protein